MGSDINDVPVLISPAVPFIAPYVLAMGVDAAGPGVVCLAGLLASIWQGLEDFTALP